MPIDLRLQLSKLAVFCQVVEKESVTKAAQELSMAQPAVTSQVQSLQRRIGLELIHREGHAMHPTEAGELVYEWAKDILTRSQELERRLDGLADGTRGTAALAASMAVGSYILAPILTEFKAARPLAQLRLDMYSPEQAITAIEAGEYDFGLLVAADSTLQGPLKFERVGYEDFVLVAGPKSDLPATISAKRLPKLSFVTSRSNRARERLLSDLLAVQNLEPSTTTIELGHAEAMKQAVEGSTAVSFLLRKSVAGELQRGELRQIKLRGLRPLQAPIYLAYRREKSFSVLQKALVEEIREALA